MRYIKVSIVPLFLLLFVAASLPAAASEDFEDWALKKGGELDGRWDRAAVREAGVAPMAKARRKTTASRRTTAMRTASPMKRAGWPSDRGGRGNTTGVDGSTFTKRGDQEFLRMSTRERNGATRGVSKLSSPAQALRASSSNRRMPGNNSAKYRRTVGSGRAGAWRRSPKMGTRTSTTARSRRSAGSGLRGASRTRRSARSGR